MSHRSTRLACLLLTAAIPAQAPPAVPIGAAVDAEFTDRYWQQRRLADFGTPPATVLYFATVECPMVARYLPRLGEVAHDYESKGVVTIVANAGVGDGFVDAVAQVVEHAPAAVFAKDGELALARACGVDRTGAVVVLDRERRLRYRGRIDAQHGYTATRPGAAPPELRQALDAVLAGEAVEQPETPITGCRLTPPLPIDPTRAAVYSRDVAPLLSRSCHGCHEGDAAGPFALTVEADVKKHGAMIAEVVGNGRMPPWTASTRVGAFMNVRAMTLTEREVVRSWFLAGMPTGGDEHLAVRRHPKTREWRLGPPDRELVTATPVEVPASGAVPYQYLELAGEFAHDTWVQSIELRPESARVLHHANLAIVPEGGSFHDGRIVANYVSHGSALAIEPGAALRIPATSRLILQAYYVPSGRATVDRVRVAIRYPRAPVKRELRVVSARANDLVVPAAASAHRAEAALAVPDDADAVALLPQLHLRGRDVTVFAEVPGGGREPLLVVPTYHFAAQEWYVLARGSRSFAKGTRLVAIAHYDNSSWNPGNPDPAAVVHAGRETTDEALALHLWWLPTAIGAPFRVDLATGARVASADDPAK
jgi:hypothetical protein